MCVCSVSTYIRPFINVHVTLMGHATVYLHVDNKSLYVTLNQYYFQKKSLSISLSSPDLSPFKYLDVIRTFHVTHSVVCRHQIYESVPEYSLR